MKSRLNYKTSVKAKTSKTMYVVVGFSLSVIVALGCYLALNFGNSENAMAATPKKSKVEKKGDWEIGNSWDLGSVPSGEDITIDGTVRRNGNLSLKNQVLTVATGDTLIITGSLEVDNNSDVTVMNEAALIVRDDYVSKNKSLDIVRGGGTMIILGKISLDGGGANIEINKDGNIYYDKTLNSGIAGKITGAGNSYDIGDIPNDFQSFVSDGPMPVRMSDFSADVSDNKIYLNWEMEDELEVSLYEIEKSTNGTDFEKIGEEEALETGSYSFTDNKAKSGQLFYRIAMVKFDQSKIYSPITQVHFSSNAHGITLFPNVSKGNEINFQGEDLQNKSIKVMVYDLNGKVIHSNNIETNEGDSYQVNFGKQLNRGNYFIHFAYDNQVFKEKFIVAY